MEELAEAEEKAKSLIPKLNDKVDYKPESLGDKGYFVTGSITACNEEPKEKGEKSKKYHLKISYILDNNSK